MDEKFQPQKLFLAEALLKVVHSQNKEKKKTLKLIFSREILVSLLTGRQRGGHRGHRSHC